MCTSICLYSNTFDQPSLTVFNAYYKVDGDPKTRTYLVWDGMVIRTCLISYVVFAELVRSSSKRVDQRKAINIDIAIELF